MQKEAEETQQRAANIEDRASSLAQEMETAQSELASKASTLSEELEATRTDLQAAQESVEQLTIVRTQLQNVATDRDAQKLAKQQAEEEVQELKSAKEAAEVEVQELRSAKGETDSEVEELRQSVQEKDIEIKSIKKEAKGAHASLDSISQEADRLSTACQQAADRSSGVTSPSVISIFGLTCILGVNSPSHLQLRTCKCCNHVVPCLLLTQLAPGDAHGCQHFDIMT